MPVPTPGALKDAEYLGSAFGVELDNGIIGTFREVSGLSVTIAAAEFTDTDPKGNVLQRKRPGVTTFSEITLKRTMSPDKSFWDWVKKIRDGAAEYRTDGAVVLYSRDGAESGRWTFNNAWPKKWSGSDLDVGTDDPMIEEITLSVEHLKREK